MKFGNLVAHLHFQAPHHWPDPLSVVQHTSQHGQLHWVKSRRHQLKGGGVVVMLVENDDQQYNLWKQVHPPSNDHIDDHAPCVDVAIARSEQSAQCPLKKYFYS